MGIAWRDAMSTGVTGLDNDHKNLIAMINGVEQALSGFIPSTIGKLFDDLMAYVEAHFAREEKVMSALNFPEIEAHHKLHQDLAAKAHLLESKFKAATTDDERRKVGTVLNSFLQEWLVNHILKEDLKLKSLVPARPEPQKPVVQQSWGEVPAANPKQTVAQSWAYAEVPRQGAETHKADKHQDIEYALPPELQRLLKRIEYKVTPLPEPEGGFESFDKLCEAAINRRIGKVLVFFQRYNPELDRVLPQFFLSSPEFAEKFHAAVVKFIFPTIWESRQIRVLSTSFDWANSNTETFWTHVSKQLQQVLLEGWRSGWDNLKLIEVKKPDGTRVMQVKPEMKELREMLAPSTPEAYDLPKLSNREIDTFKSLLDPANDWWDMLNRAWATCQDLYEQEKDPRVFQQKAREGAFRDNLLAAFNRYPEEWVDFLLLACHRTFPRLSSSFLNGFTRNLGRSEAEREVHMPYTIRYLRQVAEHPNILRMERDAEEEWEAQMQVLSDYIKGRMPPER